MWRDRSAILATLAAAHVAVGWHLGFQSAPGYLWSWLFVVLTALPAWRLARSGFAWAGTADAAIRAGILGFGIIVFAGLLLGAVGLIAIVPYLCILMAGAAVSVVVPSMGRGAATSRPAVPIALAAVALPLLAFIVAVGLAQSAPTLYDSVSYHLLFSARWLQEHRLSIVPTPFSDPAQAYQPGNGELFLLWLMLPIHGDLLARAGQVPFLAFAAIALYGLARRSGARAEHAYYAPFFFLLARPVVEQAAGADVDLICTATFLASIHLGLTALDRDTRRDWAIWGVSVGLFLGSKYLALVYLAVLLLLPLVRGLRLKALWAIPGILVFGAPWYVRNWILAGSPIFPASLKVAGVLVARGAFSREAMNNSVFHVTDPRLLPAILAHAFGAATIVVWLPCAIAGVIAMAVRRRWWPGAYIAAVPPLIVALFWLAIPDNADSRFLLPAVAVAMVPLSWTFGSDRRWNAAIHGVYMMAAAWILVGAAQEIPASLPWFMGHWLTLEGLIVPGVRPLFGIAVAIAAIVYGLSRRTTHGFALLTAAWTAACVGLILGPAAPRSLEDVRLLALSPTFIRAGMLAGWDWLHHNVAHSTIANTGNNLPYPLFDAQLSNRVVYVNIDRHADWRFHDYARTRRRATELPGGALAKPSGQLMPLAGAIADASRPRYERWEGAPDEWLSNLRTAEVEYLFVSVLSSYELDFQQHDAGGFPVEDAWARADPRIFTLLYENGTVRIYRVAFP